MYNIFSNKSLKINKFSIKNIIFFVLLVVLVMGFHVWIVVKTLTMLDDVSSVIILKRSKLFTQHLTKHLPDVPLHVLVRDQDMWERRHSLDYCPKRNCILVDDKCYSSEDYILFDAVMHGQRTLTENRTRNRPERSKVLNIFTSMSPPTKVACDSSFDSFFHLTFTYRLDSDIVFKSFVVRNFMGDIIAPAIAPPWNSSLTVCEAVISIVSSKTNAVLYLNYGEPEDSKNVKLTELENALSEKSLKIDTYNCSDDDGIEPCGADLPDDFYFYVIFEKYIADDYVSDRILQAYDNYVVPIIFGGANYSRFLPPHSYIDGYLTDARDIAATIKKSMDKFTYYKEFFKWKSMYTMERYQPFCDVCDTLNSLSNNPPAKKYFRKWWYGEEDMKQHLLSPKENETTESNTKETPSNHTETNEGIPDTSIEYIHIL